MASSSALFALLALLLPLLLTGHVRAANPVAVPIIPNDMDVYTERFAKLPDENGSPAAIISIVPRAPDLYVCTLTSVYRVTPTADVSLYLDVAAAINQNTLRTLSTQNKQHGGVRSIAFHPDFATNNLLYISAMEERPPNSPIFTYISDVPDPIDADSVLLEFRHDPATALPVPDSYRLVFRVGMPVYDHPIKQVAFHASLLYVAHGDGSVQSATAGGGQRDDALGKILRIDPREAPDGAPYTVPADNPFVAATDSFPPEVWAYGFRNPHHICFGSDGTLFVADAGRANVEEVNVVKKGLNYGWSLREGTFQHTGGGLLTGVSPLPDDDEAFGFEYPVAQVGHEGDVDAGIIGQAIAGGCPVENASPMAGHYFYSDFPTSGKLYFSTLEEIDAAVTNGPPDQLTQARTRQARIFFDHDDDPATPPLLFETLGDAMRSEPQFATQNRVDVRFGRGSDGELYWSSKRSGRIYLFTSSVPGGPGGRT